MDNRGQFWVALFISLLCSLIGAKAFGESKIVTYSHTAPVQIVTIQGCPEVAAIYSSPCIFSFNMATASDSGFVPADESCTIESTQWYSGFDGNAWNKVEEMDEADIWIKSQSTNQLSYLSYPNLYTFYDACQLVYTCGWVKAEVLLDCPSQSGVVEESCTKKTWYIDYDGDGYGMDSDPGVVACECPYTDYGYGCSLNNEDCLDIKDKEIGALYTPNTIWYEDKDHDGFGNPQRFKRSCQSPAGQTIGKNGIVTQNAGYTLDGSDCDDTDPLLRPDKIHSICVDADGDMAADYSTKTPISSCELFEMTGKKDIWEAYEAMAGYGYCLEGLTDCNDNNPNEGYPSWYVDKDQDGYGDAAQIKALCHKDFPVNTSLAKKGGDCNDANPDKHPDQLWYHDFDGDKVGSGKAYTACDPDKELSLDEVCQSVRSHLRVGSDFKCGDHGQGWVLVGGDDCKPFDKALTTDPDYFLDIDGDSFGEEGKTVKCSQMKPATSDDCMSHYKMDFQNFLPHNWEYKEIVDLDLYCHTAANDKAIKWVKRAGDCEPFEKRLNPSVTWYFDADGDFLGDRKDPGSKCGFDGFMGFSQCRSENGKLACRDKFALKTCTDKGHSFEFCELYFAESQWVDNNNDCFDTDPQNTDTYFMDADNDNVGNGDDFKCSFEGDMTDYKKGIAGNDCDDLDDAIQGPTVLYRDLDLDGLGDAKKRELWCENKPYPPNALKYNYVENRSDFRDFVKSESLSQNLATAHFRSLFYINQDNKDSKENNLQCIKFKKEIMCIPPAESIQCSLSAIMNFKSDGLTLLKKSDVSTPIHMSADLLRICLYYKKNEAVLALDIKNNTQYLVGEKAIFSASAITNNHLVCSGKTKFSDIPQVALTSVAADLILSDMESVKTLGSLTDCFENTLIGSLNPSGNVVVAHVRNGKAVKVPDGHAIYIAPENITNIPWPDFSAMPISPDSDKDGLSDGEEVDLSKNGQLFGLAGTMNINSPDSDGDGADDLFEWKVANHRPDLAVDSSNTPIVGQVGADALFYAFQKDIEPDLIAIDNKAKQDALVILPRVLDYVAEMLPVEFINPDFFDEVTVGGLIKNSYHAYIFTTSDGSLYSKNIAAAMNLNDHIFVDLLAQYERNSTKWGDVDAAMLLSELTYSYLHESLHSLLMVKKISVELEHDYIDYILGWHVVDILWDF